MLAYDCNVCKDKHNPEKNEKNRERCQSTAGQCYCLNTQRIENTELWFCRDHINHYRNFLLKEI